MSLLFYPLDLVHQLKQFKPTQYKVFQKNLELKGKIYEITSFLPTNFSIRYRIYYIINNIHTPILCAGGCNTIISRWNNKQKKFNETCSYKCMRKNPASTDKRNNTNIKRYGVDNPFKSSVIQNKAKAVMTAKYGEDNPSKIQSFRDKRDLTFFQKYGAHPLTLRETVDKRKNTFIKKYGVDNASKVEEFYNKKTEAHKKNYGYDVNSQKNTHLVHHLLNNKDWLINEHHTRKQTVSAIAQHLNVDLTTVVFYLKKHNVKQIYHTESSQPERDIIEMLSTVLNKDDIIANDRTLIFPLEIDIYIPRYKLAIEFCGLYWHNSSHERMSNTYHKNKMILCNKQGVRLLTIFEDEWKHNSILVKEKILCILQKLHKKTIYARRCLIANVDCASKRTFFDTNHIQGDGPSSINIGLYHNNILIACMGFIKQRNNCYILNRYATSCNVPGGFTKLLTYFKLNFEWSKIISFADLRWSNGELYCKTGWVKDKILPPDYSYVDTAAIKRIHKFNFRHRQLAKKLNNYQPNLSESQNTKLHNIYKIWDCGKIRFIMSK